MQNKGACRQNLAPVLCLTVLLGCSAGPPEMAKECGVSDEQFEEAWNDATPMKPYSARAIGKCNLLNDDAGNVFISTPEDRLRLETQLKPERQAKPTSPTSFSAIQLDGGSFALAVKHVLIPEKGQLKVINKQNGDRFCVVEQSLYFNSALDLGPGRNALLEVKPSVVASKYYGQKPSGFNISNVTSFKKLTENSGRLTIDISAFYENRRLLVGHRAIELYPCSQLFGEDSDPVITPVVYEIELT